MSEVFNLFKILENETLQMLSMREKHQSKHKFGGTKVCKAKEVRKYFINSISKIMFLASV